MEISAGILTFFKGSCNNKVVKIVEYNSPMQLATTIKSYWFLLVTTYTIKCIQLFKPIAFQLVQILLDNMWPPSPSQKSLWYKIILQAFELPLLGRGECVLCASGLATVPGERTPGTRAQFLSTIQPRE